MGSSRLPGKVLQDIAGRPMLARVVERTRRAGRVDEVIVATTSDALDDPMAEYCESQSYTCFRGSTYDVLDRYYQATRQYKADMVVRITADCPVIDPALVNEVVKVAMVGQYDFAANRLPLPWGRTFPIGLDTEVCSLAALERAWKESAEDYQREHVMPYLYEGTKLTAESGWLSTGVSPRGFKIALLNHVPGYGSLRWTVDTSQDLEFIRQVFTRFEGRDDFTWEEVLELIHAEPQLMEINADVQHKTLKDVDERALE
jgi:spore coat polysaccharide biosynthesis protein SpsF